MKRLLTICLATGWILLTPIASTTTIGSSSPELWTIAFEQPPGHYGGYLSGQYGDYPPEFYTIIVADDFQLS